MNRKELEEALAKDNQKLSSLKDTEMKGFNHLIEYLKMKDDKDFLDLGMEVHKLLTAIYHLMNEEERFLEILDAKGPEHAAQIMMGIIKKLDEELNKDMKAIRSNKNIKTEELLNLINLFKQQVKQIKI